MLKDLSFCFKIYKSLVSIFECVFLDRAFYYFDWNQILLQSKTSYDLKLKIEFLKFFLSVRMDDEKHLFFLLYLTDVKNSKLIIKYI